MLILKPGFEIFSYGKIAQLLSTILFADFIFNSKKSNKNRKYKFNVNFP